MRKTFSPTIFNRPFRFTAHLTLWAMLGSTSPAWAEPQTSGDTGAATSDLGAAKAEFTNAQKLFKAGKFAEALPLFRNVTDTTRSPNARLYVGHCLQQLGKYVDAYKTFALVVKEITERHEDRYETTREAAIAQLAVLNVRVAKVVISLTDIPPDLAVTLDGLRVEERELGSSIVVPPGEHRVEAIAAGVAPVRREVSVDGGEVKTVTMSFRKLDDGRAAVAPPPVAPPPPPSEPTSQGGSSMRTVGYVAGGVGIAGLTLFTITGLMAKSTFDKLEGECGGGCSDPGHLGDVDSGKSLQTTANIGLVIGLLGLAGGATFVILGSSGGSKPSDGPSVSLSSRGGSISYAGHF